MALLYLNRVLGGQQFIGETLIPEAELGTIRSQIYEIIFVPSTAPDGQQEQCRFEHLLAFDPKGFFRALTFQQNKVLLLWSGPIAAACANLKLETIDLSNIGLSDTDAHGVAEIIKRCPACVKFNLNNNHIGNAGADYLLNAIQQNQNVEELTLENNVVSLQHDQI